MRRAIAVTALGLVTGVLAACSTTPTPTGPAPIKTSIPAAPTASPTTAPTSSASPSPSPSAAAASGRTFTVTGDNPVTPNGSQDTSAAADGASCDNGRLRADQALGASIAGGFSLQGFPAAADLLQHFLGGTGTEIDYGVGSSISDQARASAGLQTVNAIVQGEIEAQLKDGQDRVTLSAAQLPTVLFASTASDLYWGFRGTQGLTVTGSGERENGGYTGTLTYVIADSYGFPADDTLDGFGPPMRYLQTVCGAPQHSGGARWFPDTITVRVPFDSPG